jgi:RecB family exonuclease
MLALTLAIQIACQTRPLTDIFEALQTLAVGRARDPLVPVTVIAPSHAAALQLRRRLAGHGPFAAVRFETLARVAELLGAGSLAADGRSPLARPIGDYAAELVARDSRGALEAVGDLPGYARVLRQIFRRLRRGGIRSSADVRIAAIGHVGEILRLYDRFRQATAFFYDEDDLLDAAAASILARRSGFLADLGEVYVVPPKPQSAAGAALIEALRTVAAVTGLDEPSARPEETFLIAPDPASEAQQAVRLVLEALGAGVPLHEVAVFHGAGEGYGRLLREAFAAAGVTAVPLPGVPVAETRSGRGLLLLARLPELDYSRTGTIDSLSVAPIREWLPGTAGNVHEMTSTWDKISRDAGITRGPDRWRRQLKAYSQDRTALADGLHPAESEMRIDILRREGQHAERLLTVIEALVARLELLRQPQAAAVFIEAFKRLVEEYLEPGAEGLDEALEEIEQLGTVGALGGEFSLDSFAVALGANLEARCIRPHSIGDGVIIADYRMAAGMRFERVVLCGAYEGAFPASPGADAILDDRIWQALRREHPFIEDASARMERAEEAADRAVASAGAGALTWSAPAYESGGMREYFPSPPMAKAYSQIAGREVTASDLRRGVAQSDALQRPPSPLAVALRGPVLSAGELALRRAVALAQDRRSVPPDHARLRAVESLKARRRGELTEWDGNLAALDDPTWLELQGAVSPTSLEVYASCGFRYFCRSLLRLQTIEEPDERQVMDPRERGTLIHEVLEKFFIEQQARGRPQPDESWTAADLERVVQIADEKLAEAKARGLTGLDVFAEHEARTIRADLAQFLEADTIFRRETGAVPSEFEAAIPEQTIAGVRLRGRVDRIDRTPDGSKAWVIDYKTGSDYGMSGMDRDPLQGGTKLQLPVYLAAAGDASQATALYWFISRKAGFARVPYLPSDDRDARFQDTLEAIVGGIRAGAFPAVPGEEDEWRNGFENCKYCEFNRICSRRRDMEFQAKVEHKGMLPWRGVGQAASLEPRS